MCRNPLVTNDQQWEELEATLVDSGRQGAFFHVLVRTIVNESTDQMHIRQQMLRSELWWLSPTWQNVLRWLNTRNVRYYSTLVLCYVRDVMFTYLKKRPQ